ncbi:MAG: hypothetical protein LIR50_15045 [Bacillota bacterium]|nr:hypothetical protein [Bacillota bacterium]
MQDKYVSRYELSKLGICQTVKGEDVISIPVKDLIKVLKNSDLILKNLTALVSTDIGSKELIKIINKIITK